MGAVDLVRGVNFGPDHNLGTDIADKITVNIDGTTIVRDAAGVLSAPTAGGGLLAVTGYLNVQSDGTIAASGGGAGATRAGVGRYNVTPPAGAVAAVVTVFEPENLRDAISGHFTDFTFTRLYIVESDNGATAGIYRDRAFSVLFLG